MSTGPISTAISRQFTENMNFLSGPIKSGMTYIVVLVSCLVVAGLFPISSYAAKSIDEVKFDSKTSKELLQINSLIEKQELNKALNKIEPIIKKNPAVAKLHLIKANILTETKGETEALTYLTGQIKQQPDNVSLVAARAQYLLSRAHIESAREDFYHAYEKNFRPGEILSVLADIEKGKGNFAKSLELTQQALALDSKQDELWFKKAELELKLAQIKEAKQSCFQATRLAPGNINYHKLYVEILIYLKQRKELEKHIREMHELFPTDPWIGLRMSSLMVEEGNLNGAIEILLKSLKENPDDQLLMFQIATIFAGERKWEESIKFFKAGLEKEPDSSWAMIQLAKVYLQNGNPREAIEYLERARENETGDSFVYETLARIYNQQGDTFEAERVILEGLEINDKDQTLILEYANLLEKRGKIKEAIKTYEEGLRNDPESSFILGKLGNLYRLDNAYDKSLDALEKAISFNPKATWIRAYYIETLDEQENWDKALTEIDNLLKIMPDDYWAYAKKALIEFETGKLDSALASISRSISLKPEAEWLNEIEGRILEGLNKYPEAEAAFKEALIRTPQRIHILTRLAYVQVHTNKKQALVTIKQAIASDDFDLGTIELYLYLTGQAEQYWKFSKNSQEYKVYEQIIQKQFALAEKGLKKLEKQKSSQAPFLSFFLIHMQKEKDVSSSVSNLPDSGYTTPWHLYYLGIQSMRDEEYRIARDAFEKGLDLSNGNPWIMIKLAYVYQQLKQHQKAVDLLNRFLGSEQNGEYLWVQLRLALNYDLAKKFTDSERVYKRILEKNPEDNVALNNLAWMYLNATEKSMHKLDDALKLALKAVEIRPSSANLDTLAEAYYQIKDYSKALKAIEKALDKDRRGLDDFKKTKKKILRAMEAEVQN